MRVTDMVIKFITVRIDEKHEEDREAESSSRQARCSAAPAATGDDARGSCCPGCSAAEQRCRERPAHPHRRACAGTLAISSRRGTWCGS